MASDDSTPAAAVVCGACGRRWNSRAMAEGLRLVGACPRCGGALRFADVEPPAGPANGPDDDGPEPHLVLGIPRR